VVVSRYLQPDTFSPAVRSCQIVVKRKDTCMRLGSADLYIRQLSRLRAGHKIQSRAPRKQYADHHTCGYDKDPDCFHGSLEPPSGLYDPHDHIDAYSPDSNYVADLIDHYKRACLRHEQSRRDHGKYKNA